MAWVPPTDGEKVTTSKISQTRRRLFLSQQTTRRFTHIPHLARSVTAPLHICKDLARLFYSDPNLLCPCAEALVTTECDECDSPPEVWVSSNPRNDRSTTTQPSPRVPDDPQLCFLSRRLVDEIPKVATSPGECDSVPSRQSARHSPDDTGWTPAALLCFWDLCITLGMEAVRLAPGSGGWRCLVGTVPEMDSYRLCFPVWSPRAKDTVVGIVPVSRHRHLHLTPDCQLYAHV